MLSDYHQTVSFDNSRECLGQRGVTSMGKELKSILSLVTIDNTKTIPSPQKATSPIKRLSSPLRQTQTIQHTLSRQVRNRSALVLGAKKDSQPSAVAKSEYQTSPTFKGPKNNLQRKLLAKSAMGFRTISKGF